MKKLICLCPLLCLTGTVPAAEQSSLALPRSAPEAQGVSSADDTYTAKLCFHETATSLIARLKFSGEQLLYDAEFNVAFGPTKQPQLVGRAE